MGKDEIDNLASKLAHATIRAVWKFPLPLTQGAIPETGGKVPFELELPEGAVFLSMAAQGSSLVAYFLVEPARKTTTRHYSLLGTGEQFTDCGEFDFVASLGGAGFHLFEVR